MAKTWSEWLAELKVPLVVAAVTGVFGLTGIFLESWLRGSGDEPPVVKKETETKDPTVYFSILRLEPLKETGMPPDLSIWQCVPTNIGPSVLKAKSVEFIVDKVEAIPADVVSARVTSDVGMPINHNILIANPKVGSVYSSPIDGEWDRNSSLLCIMKFESYDDRNHRLTGRVRISTDKATETSDPITVDSFAP